MRIFITGAGGFIGFATARQLLARGHTVSGLTSRESGKKTLREAGINPVLGDLRQPQHWIRHVQDADAVIHLATLSIPGRPGNKYVRELTKVQQAVTTQMLEALSPDCKAFIYTSGISVYGNRPGIHNEAIAPDPCRIARPYVAGEQIVLKAFEQGACPAMILRPAGVYGFGGVFGRFWSGPILKDKRTIVPGHGKQLFSFIHIEDCARAFVQCVENPMPGEIFNIADNEPVPLGVMIRSFAKTLNAPGPLNMPSVLFNLLAGSVVGELLLNNKVADNQKMKNLLHVELKYPDYRAGIAALASQVNAVPS